MYFLVILNKIWCCVNLVNSHCFNETPGLQPRSYVQDRLKRGLKGRAMDRSTSSLYRCSVSLFCAKVGAKHDILQNIFTYFLLINFVSVCPWIRKTKCTDQPALNFLRELFGQRLCFLKWKYVMFNLCNGAFRIEGSGDLRKPLQLGCDCQLLKP